MVYGVITIIQIETKTFVRDCRFRINTFNAEKLAESEKAGPLKRKLRSRVSDSDSSDSDAAAKKKDRGRSPGSSR